MSTIKPIDIAKPFHRQNAVALDDTSVFDELNEDGTKLKLTILGTTTEFENCGDLADFYSKCDISYKGQLFSVYDLVNKIYMLYIVDEKNGIKEAREIKSFTAVNTSYTSNEIPEIE